MGVKGLLLGLNKIGWIIAGKCSECINLSVWDRDFATSKAHSETFGTNPILAPNPFNNDCSDINIFFSLTSTDVELLRLSEPAISFKPGAIWISHSGYSEANFDYLNKRGLESVSAIIPDEPEKIGSDSCTIMAQGKEKTILKIIGILQMIGQVNIEK
ncbi:unnamed protein product [Blepharisma stoltei]|uniref:6-phosphogluconate dehydrogenase NADP-binding domain-containing protein n=1 Tax=Blepharisma stoltei TaxID=1481888 RepID=A0AAU9IP52_9CILI|nr:unnamed protein product [Blepharisma stoltei]